MDELVKLIMGLAWPTVVLTIFFNMKNQFCALIDRTKHIKHKDTEVSFNEQLQEIAAKVKEQPRIEPVISAPTTDIEQLVSNLIRVDAYSAVLAAWVHFSKAARDRLDSPSAESASPARLIDALRREDLITSHDAEVLHLIRGLRNHAAHYRSTEIDQETVWKACRVLLVISDELANKEQPNKTLHPTAGNAPV
jgi:hypothetical protein